MPENEGEESFDEESAQGGKGKRQKVVKQRKVKKINKEGEEVI